MHDTYLTELLCTRLCHDLTGPIGAVNNGAEFMAEEGGMQGDAADLITSSAAEAVARLQFYRMVYGRIPAVGETGISERRPHIEAYLAGSKIALHWQVPVDQGGLPHAVFRLLCNMVLITAAAFLRKGAIHVETSESDHAWHVRLHTEGGSVKWESLQADALAGRTPADKLEPKTAQLAFAAQLVAQCHGTIEAEVKEGALHLQAHVPHRA